MWNKNKKRNVDRYIVIYHIRVIKKEKKHLTSLGKGTSFLLVSRMHILDIACKNS